MGPRAVEGETERDEKFTRYLLGDLSEEERARLEELYFTDDAAFESFLAARDELVDLHARGELKGGRRERFEGYFLSTGPRRRRAREAKELVDFSTAIAAADGREKFAAGGRERGASRLRSLLPSLGLRAPALRYALAALLLCAALGGAWLLFKRAGPAMPERAAVTPPPPAPESVAERQPDEGTRPRPAETRPGDVADAPAPPAATPTPRRAQEPDTAVNRGAGSPPASTPRAAGVASILLTPVLTRGDGRSNTLLVGPDTVTARLRLSFKGGGYRRYVAVLQTVEGGRVWRGAAPRAEASGAGEVVVVNVPASVLRRKDYIVTLSGVTAGGETREINEYFLTVRKD